MFPWLKLSPLHFAWLIRPSCLSLSALSCGQFRSSVPSWGCQSPLHFSYHSICWTWLSSPWNCSCPPLDCGPREQKQHLLSVRLSPHPWVPLKEKSSVAMSVYDLEPAVPALNSLGGHQPLCGLSSFLSALLQHLPLIRTSMTSSPPALPVTRHCLFASPACVLLFMSLLWLLILQAL